MSIVHAIDPGRPCGKQLQHQLDALGCEVSHLMRSGLKHEDREAIQKAIHKARRCLKAMIAVIALLQDACRHRHLRSMRNKCKAALRRLGTSRDAQVVDELLAKNHETASNAAAADRHAMKTVKRLAKRLHEGTRQLRVHHGRRYARAALRRSWKKANHAAICAQEEPTDEHLHELRRHAIRLKIQALVLREFSSRSMLNLDALRELCSDLGDHHDLTLAVTHLGRRHIPGMTTRTSALRERALTRTRHIFGSTCQIS